MTIPAEILAFFLLVLLVGALGLGFGLGLWVGERGRRRDMQWWTGLQKAPTSDEERGVEKEIVGNVENDALERAEVAAIMEGLQQELVRDGRPIPSQEELRDEALRIVSQYHIGREDEL